MAFLRKYGRSAAQRESTTAASAAMYNLLRYGVVKASKRLNNCVSKAFPLVSAMIFINCIGVYNRCQI